MTYSGLVNTLDGANCLYHEETQIYVRFSKRRPIFPSPPLDPVPIFTGYTNKQQCRSKRTNHSALSRLTKHRYSLDTRERMVAAMSYTRLPVGSQVNVVEKRVS